VNVRKVVTILANALGDRLSRTEQGELEMELNRIGQATSSAATYGGKFSSVSVSNVSISDGLYVRNPVTGKITVALEPDGDSFFGSDVLDPSKTSMVVFATDQNHNGEYVTYGDLLLGDNSDNKANLLWDRSTGRLLFRTGTTVKAYIDTDGRLYAVDAVLSGTITATAGAIGGWSITPTSIYKGWIVLDSATEQIRVGDVGDEIIVDGINQQIRSTNYVSGISGFVINGPSGDAEFNNVRVRGELHAAVFVKDLIEAHAGTSIWTFSSGSLSDDMVVPASGTWFMYINDPPGGGFLFVNGDRCRCRSEYTGGINDTWFTVSLRTNMGDGRQRYTCTWQSGTRPTTHPAAAVVLDYGAASGAMVSITADGAIGYAPNLSMMTHAGSPWLTQTLQVRIGNMRDSYGTGAFDRYGMGIGDYAGGNYLSYNAEIANAFKIKTGAGNAVLGNLRGEFGTGAFDRYGLGVGNYAGGNYLSYNAETAGAFILKAGAGVVVVDGTGIRVLTGTGKETSRTYSFYAAAVYRGGLYGHDPGTINTIGVIAESIASRSSTLNLNAYAPSTYTGLVSIEAKSSTTTATLEVRALSGDTPVIRTTNANIRIDSATRGLVVGATAIDPDPQGILAMGHASLMRGLSVGLNYDAGTGNILAAANIRSSAFDISGWLPFTAYQYLPDGITLNGNPFAATLPRDGTIKLWRQTVHVTFPNSASAYWSIHIRRISDGASLGSFNTSTYSPGVWTRFQSGTLTYNLTAATHLGVYISASQVGSPGALRMFGPSVYYE
jgi:hypothetical protein